MKVVLLSPFHGGSHQDWAEGYQQCSRHELILLTLPARFWKWRMHGGAVTLAGRFLAQDIRPDMILATDMLDLTTFLALTHFQGPVALYMHENQLTYPLPAGGDPGPMARQYGEPDLHYAFINYTSMLAAQTIFFNSRYHQQSWFAALPKLLKHFPDYRELPTIARLQARSQVLPVGLRLSKLARPEHLTQSPTPLILWNQRWEYDKNPTAFFRALYQIANEGIPFRLALCGQQSQPRPVLFAQAITRLSNQIIHVGYADPDTYRQLLWEAAIIISTADHEFFGISILEAITCHTFPILPHRLSYPELIPEPFHRSCLYQNEAGLLERLRWALIHPAQANQIANELAPAGANYAWQHIASQYDQALLHCQLEYQLNFAHDLKEARS